MANVTQTNTKMAEITDNDYVNVRFYCKVCDKEISNKNNWKRHYATHSTDFSFHCSVCGKGFREHYVLKRHEKVHK